jgi:hypothetical protein
MPNRKPKRRSPIPASRLEGGETAAPARRLPSIVFYPDCPPPRVDEIAFGPQASWPSLSLPSTPRCLNGVPKLASRTSQNYPRHIRDALRGKCRCGNMLPSARQVRQWLSRIAAANDRVGRAMKTELIVALIAGVVASASAVGTFWSSRRTNFNALAIKRLEIDNEASKVAAQRQNEISRFSEPLARSAYDLQSRLYNILRKNLVEAYLVRGNEREKKYIVNNTVFLIAQFQCWSEIVRRRIQFIDLGKSEQTRKLLHLQDDLYDLWGTDAYPPVLRIFTGEQRALGDALIQTDEKGLQLSECIGYGTFLKTFAPSTNPLIDALRTDFAALSINGVGAASERLKAVQNALIDLLLMLDPGYIRFPEDRRSKA